MQPRAALPRRRSAQTRTRREASEAASSSSTPALHSTTATICPGLVGPTGLPPASSTKVAMPSRTAVTARPSVVALPKNSSPIRRQLNSMAYT
jgi:hypothetical protein